MVRIRHSDSVKIQISGPRRIIPHTRIEIGRRSMTWGQFVMEVCKIKLDRKKEYFICTAGYSPNHSVEGWTASLNDPIESFVTNYTKKLKKYSVRLHRGPAPQKTEMELPQTQTPSQTQPYTEIVVQNNSSLYESPQKPILSLAAKKFASISPLKPSQLAELAYQQNLDLNIMKEQNMGVDSIESHLKCKRRKRSKKTPSPPKLERYDEINISIGDINSSNVKKNLIVETGRKSVQIEMIDLTDDGEMVNGESAMTRNLNVNLKQDETLIIDLLELEEKDEEMNYKKEGSAREDRFNEGEYQFDRLVSKGKFEKAAEVIEQEMKESEREMKDLMTRFEQSIDTFDENLLEQIKLEVISLKQNGMWDRNMKRSPLACYLIEEICKV